MTRCLSKLGLMLCVTLGFSPNTWGQTSNTQSIDDTDARWERAHIFFGQGDYGAALAEYLEVYKRRPAPIVQYNIGRTQAKLGRPVEAVESLNSCLSSPGNLTKEVQKIAEELRDEQELRIGRVLVSADVMGAAIAIDHIARGRTPKSIRVVSGIHLITVIAPGYVAMGREIYVAGGIEEKAQFELVPLEGKAARLMLVTDVPDAEILVDGIRAGKTPLLGLIKVLPGKHRIEVTRLGYLPFAGALTVPEGDILSLPVKLDENSRWIVEHGGQLQLELSESHVMVTVNGTSRGEYRAKLHLAPGLHRLRLERAGFQTIEREVHISAGQTTTERIQFEPNPETLVNSAQEYRWQKAVGARIGAVGGGIVIVSGIALLALGINYDTSCTVQKSDASLCTHLPAWVGGWGGFAGVGLGAFGAGIWVFRTNVDPTNYEIKQSGKSASAVWLAPTVGPLPGGAGVSLVGAF